MTTGESLLTIVILFSIGFGLYKIHQKKMWKLVGKIVSIIIVITLLISVGFYIYKGYQDRPREVSSLGGISLGMKKVDVTIKKGKPDLERVGEEETTTLFYKDYLGTLVLRLDYKGEVYRICSLEYHDKVFKLGKYDSIEQVTKKMGEPQEKSINKDGTLMLITYPQYNVAFQISEGVVNMTCVTTEEKISFIEEYVGE